MRKKTMATTHKGNKVKYRYEIHKAENIRVIRITADDGFDGAGECEIVLAKLDYYYIAFPDMGAASAGYSSLDYATVSDIVSDAGFWQPDVEAITLAIMEAVKNGF